MSLIKVVNNRHERGCWGEGPGMSMDRLLKEIERLRVKMEYRGREECLNNKDLVQLSERLDRLINIYQLRSGRVPSTRK